MDDTDIHFMNSFGLVALRQNQLELAIWLFGRVNTVFFPPIRLKFKEICNFPNAYLLT